MASAVLLSVLLGCQCRTYPELCNEFSWQLIRYLVPLRSGFPFASYPLDHSPSKSPCTGLNCFNLYPHQFTQYKGAMAAITVNGNTINPESDKFVSDNSKGSNFIYVQGFHDLTTEEKQQLAQLHVEIAEYVSEHTYLCRYEPDDIKRLQELPFVKASNM